MGVKNFTDPYQGLKEEFQKNLNAIQNKLGLQDNTNDEISTNSRITNGFNTTMEAIGNTTMKVIGTVGSGIVSIFNATHNATESSNEWQLNTNGTNSFNSTDYSTEGNNHEENRLSLYYLIGGIATPIIIGGVAIYVYVRCRSPKNIKQNPTNEARVVYLTNPMYATENQERPRPIIDKPAKSFVRYRMLDENGYNIPPLPLPFGPGYPRDIANYQFIDRRALPRRPTTISSEDNVQDEEEHRYEPIIYKELTGSSHPEKTKATYANTSQTWYDSPRNTNLATRSDANDTLKNIDQDSSDSNNTAVYCSKVKRLVQALNSSDNTTVYVSQSPMIDYQKTYSERYTDARVVEQTF